MPTITRTVPTGNITDADQLQRELNVAASLIGASCTGVAIYTGAPNDTISMDFDAVPTGAQVDAVIAAHPSYTPGLVPSLALTANTWATVWTLPLIEGERAEIDATITIDFGDASTIETSTIHLDEMVRRRAGGGAVITNNGTGGALVRYGEIPQAAARLQASGNFVQLQLRSARTATATLEGTVDVESRIVP